MKTALHFIILICAMWTVALHVENVLIHAYYRGLTLPSGARDKLTEQEIVGIAERTESRFRNSVISYMAPLSIIAIAGYGLWRSRKEVQKMIPFVENETDASNARNMKI
jgi:hypothetical protein